VVLLDEAIADSFRVGQYQRRPALKKPEDTAAISAIPSIVGKITLAGDGDGRPRQHGCWHADNVRP
jgi:hypothetical protein